MCRPFTTVCAAPERRQGRCWIRYGCNDGASQMRRDTYHQVGKSIWVHEWMLSLPEVKEVRPEFEKIEAHAFQGVTT